MNPENASRVLVIHHQIDAQTAAFRAATGLGCPTGCGRCCDNPQIEATPLEMLPMALALIHQGEAAAWLERVRRQAPLGTCVFYQADPAISGNGHCQKYTWRPLLCRLFGYAAVTDKQGLPVLSACSRLGEQRPEQLAAVQGAIATGCPVPKFADWQVRLTQLDPYWGHQHLPINQALMVALERVGLALAYQNQSA